jgi:hypothetical protein
MEAACLRRRGSSARIDIEYARGQAEGSVVRGKLCVRNRFYGQATKGVRVDALAQRGDEGRGQLR